MASLGQNSLIWLVWDKIFKCVITHQEVKSLFHTHSFSHAGFHLMYTNLTMHKRGISLTETSLGVWGRICGMDSSHTMWDTSLGCSAQLLMRNSYPQKVILVLVSLTTTWKHISGQGIFLLEDDSGNYLLWSGVNLCSQTHTLFP